VDELILYKSLKIKDVLPMSLILKTNILVSSNYLNNNIQYFEPPACPLQAIKNLLGGHTIEKGN
jgi:hypothetical protein